MAPTRSMTPSTVSKVAAPACTRRSSWPHARASFVPVEVEPLAAAVVLEALKKLGSNEPRVRIGTLDKQEPLKTDQDNFIVDAPFSTLLLQDDISEQSALKGDGEGGLWEVGALAREIKLIEGVLSVGIFEGENGMQAAARGMLKGGQKPVAAYFGMEDGSVVVRRAGEMDMHVGGPATCE